MKTEFIFRPRHSGDAPNGNEAGPTWSLADVKPGFRGTVRPGEPVPLRLRELGFVPGTEVRVLRQGPLGDPIEVELRGYRICLRRSDLAPLRVEPLAAEAP